MRVGGDGCWLFTGYVNAKGYGYMHFRGKQWRAHRVAWVLHFGEIPSGLNVCHSCDETSCVNPEHLFLGTQMANIRDARRKGTMRGNATPRSRPSVVRMREAALASWARLTPEQRSARIATSAVARAGKPRGRYKECPDRQCAHCGATFSVDYPSSRRRYCSRRCSRRARI